MKMQKSDISVKKNFKINIWNIKNYVKLDIIVIIQEKTMDQTMDHSGSNYDCHFIVKELAEELKSKLLVLEKILKNT